MRQSFFTFIAIAAMSVAAASAIAQPTYKCGNAYSTTPCADGKVVADQDLRTEAQKRQADDTTTRQKAAASKFERDRLAQEKQDAAALRNAGSAVVIKKPADQEVRQRGKLKQYKPPKPPKPPKVAKASSAPESSKQVKADKKKKTAKPPT